MSAYGQNIEKHQWKKRVLLITSVDKKGIDKQVEMLDNERDGLRERKLIVYKILPSKYTKGIANEYWNKNEELFDQVKKNRSNFEVILIGLDGGVKLRQTKYLTAKKLFTIIDGMPMRRAEM